MASASVGGRWQRRLQPLHCLRLRRGRGRGEHGSGFWFGFEFEFGFAPTTTPNTDEFQKLERKKETEDGGASSMLGGF